MTLPDDALARARERFFQGTACFEAGELEQARAHFTAALDLAPGRPSIQANLGVTLFHLGFWEDAVDQLVPALRADAAQPDAWLALGLSRKALGQWQDAASALQQGLEAGAGDAEAWLALAHVQERLGREDDALRAVECALQRDARSAAAWSARGSLLRLMQRRDEAMRSFEQAIALGADEALHRFYLASMRGDAAPAEPPRIYVETLFDQYAEDFEQHLTEVLRYRGYEELLRPLIDAGGRHPLVLDLGCGSGLCARLIQGHAGVIDGVDLSAAMVEQARSSGLYRQVAHDDLLSFLRASREPADLVMAADVFVYVGSLEAVFAAVRERLRAGGCFAFTVEAHDGPGDLQLLPSMRYGHSPDYIARLAGEHGFAVQRHWRAVLREEQQLPIPGLYYHLAATP